MEDVLGRSLDAVTGLVLGTNCIIASVWSGGVELVVMARLGAVWLVVVNPFFNYTMTRFVIRFHDEGFIHTLMTRVMITLQRPK